MALTPAHPGVVHLDGKRYLLNPNAWTVSEIQELRASAVPRQWWPIPPIVALFVAAILGSTPLAVGVTIRSWIGGQDASLFWFVAVIGGIILASFIAPRRASRFPATSLREPRAMQLRWLKRSGIGANDDSDWKNLWRLTRHLDVLGETYDRVAAARDGIPFDGKLETPAESEAALQAHLDTLAQLVAAARVTFDADAFRERRRIPSSG